MGKPQGLSMIQVLILALVVFALGAGVFLVIREERAQTRDAKRMADMARLSAAFFELYSTEGSYATAAEGGCTEQGSSVSTCNLAAYLPDIASFKDPKGGAYIIQGVPGEASFVVLFTLERSYNFYVAGNHALTPQGIQ
ncbi:MAG: hypothetical protein WC495_03835 [Patescibacteria group bacterium]|jgi:hypothetical protein